MFVLYDTYHDEALALMMQGFVRRPYVRKPISDTYLDLVFFVRYNQG